MERTLPTPSLMAEVNCDVALIGLWYSVSCKSSGFLIWAGKEPPNCFP